MKSLTLFATIFLLFSLNSYSQDFQKLPDSQVNQDKLQIAQGFVTNYFTSLKEGGYYDVKEKVIDALRSQLTETFQRSSYEQLKNQFGDFESLEYVETWTQSSMLIFRFKSEWESSDQILELRVVLDGSDYITGFWMRPWSDQLK